MENNERQPAIYQFSTALQGGRILTGQEKHRCGHPSIIELPAAPLRYQIPLETELKAALGLAGQVEFFEQMCTPKTILETELQEDTLFQRESCWSGFIVPNRYDHPINNLVILVLPLPCWTAEESFIIIGWKADTIEMILADFDEITGNHMQHQISHLANPMHHLM